MEQMTVSVWLTIMAIIIAPIAAVQIQKYSERIREKTDRKLKVFKTLMATRATPLSPFHVEALNMIDVEFYKDRKVTDAWKLLLDNFENYPRDTQDSNYQMKLNSCNEKSRELSTSLLCEMSLLLGYRFDKVHLMRGAYIPKGHADTEFDQEFIRKSMVGLFLGKLSIPIKIFKGVEKEGNK
jgi:hypothetical protein